MSVVVVATVWPAEGHREEVVTAFADAVEGTHAEPGCELYALHSGEDRLVLVEKWTSREHLDAHLGGRVIAELGPRLDGLLARPTEIVLLEAMPFGTAVQGAL